MAVTLDPSGYSSALVNRSGFKLSPIGARKTFGTRDNDDHGRDTASLIALGADRLILTHHEREYPRVWPISWTIFLAP
ncbi:hypothetical protein RSOLAG1IB_08295 [Rhizoctonia solani AG-1 IB]|uniref:Uncharacterized protein n=1 Tax=Thanatephorus cucumeris (strain AG1-IB / isolate 7/3/14) TaxID=1108050 RepID=A0A0B7FLI5_THACB|nr:hypothetical protein RSOLAG1IB_08295 [Rhizoctonia solani AG-1 IB]